MRKNYHFLIIFGVGFLSVFTSISIFFTNEWNINLTTFMTSVVGFVFSLWAFYIANRTYSSIDSVNVITQMEGNVLENESYVTSYTSLLKEYDMTDSYQVSSEIFRTLEMKFQKKSKTAIEFAANLQYFIDVIIFFPYLFKSPNEQEANKERMNQLLLMIDKKKDIFLSVSTGNLILIEETVNLIKSIIHYQRLSYAEEHLVHSTLLDVRGTMLKNAVTQTVYYNYLGLFYNKKAYSVIKKKFDLEHPDFFSIEGVKELKNKILLLSDMEIELFTLYLQEAKKAFQKALEQGNQDVMWEGFIKFNEARCTYLLQLVYFEYEGRNWLDLMNEALIARNRLSILIQDILESHTFLQEAFLFEYHLASLVKMNILMAEDKDLTDSFNRPKYLYPSYGGLLDDELLTAEVNSQFYQIITYQNELREAALSRQQPIG